MGEALLPQRLKYADGRRISEIQASGLRADRDADATVVVRGKKLLRQALRFLSEEQICTVWIIRLVVAFWRFRREQAHTPDVVLRKEVVQIFIVLHIDEVPVVEPRALDRFILDAAPDAPTGLKKLVAAVSADIGAVFAPGGAVQAKVFYPEYFEFLDENTPAHIFNHSIEGEGYRYRQCFDGSVLRFAEYDAAFPQACVGESEKTLCRIALDRLCSPFALLPEAQGIYSAYLAAHAASAAAPLIARRDTESLQLVLKLADEESRRQIALACSQSGWSEGAALTLGGQRPRRQKTYDFDDL